MMMVVKPNPISATNASAQELEHSYRGLYSTQDTPIRKLSVGTVAALDACRRRGSVSPARGSLAPAFSLRPRPRDLNSRRIHRHIPLNLHLQLCLCLQSHIPTILQQRSRL